MNTADVFEYHLSTGLLGRRRTLRLAPEYLEYENKNLKSDLFTRIEKASIADIRQDMNWLIWYRFYVGCDFKIDIKTEDGHVLKIRFRSYFGQNSAYIRAYNKITDHLWSFYLEPKVVEYLQALQQGQAVELHEVKLTQQGLVLFPDEPEVAWQEVRVKQYLNFYIIYREGQPQRHKQIFYYAWESEFLLSVIKSMQRASEESTAAE